MHSEWLEQKEQGKSSMVVCFDQSAAFDMLQPELLCRKMKLMGGDDSSIKWFRSFLTGRRQIVKVGGSLSAAKEVNVGSPQGSLLSPLLFVLYTSDLGEWLQHCRPTAYADDTTISLSGLDAREVQEAVEEDALNALCFMASNGLVANPSKTSFLNINPNGRREEKLSISIRDILVPESEQEKLLGMVISRDLKWASHIYGKGGLLSQLNQALYMVRRLACHLHKARLKQVGESLWMSRVRYCLPLFYGQVRLLETDPESKMAKDLQVAQNKLLRVITGTNLSQRLPTAKLLEMTGMLSINQLAAEMRLLETWKALNIEGSPLAGLFCRVSAAAMETRASAREDLVEYGPSKSFRNLSSRLWNRAGQSVREAKTLYRARKVVRDFVKTIPI